MVTLANNHALSTMRLRMPVAQTETILDRSGLVHAGTGEDLRGCCCTTCLQVLPLGASPS